MKVIQLQTIQQQKQKIIQTLDSSLQLNEACVICQFVLQKIKKQFDPIEQCPDLLNSFLVKERQRKWIPDPAFFSKWRQLFEAKRFYDLKKKKGIIADGDHVYYVAHKESKEDVKYKESKKKEFQKPRVPDIPKPRFEKKINLKRPTQIKYQDGDSKYSITGLNSATIFPETEVTPFGSKDMGESTLTENSNTLKIGNALKHMEQNNLKNFEALLPRFLELREDDDKTQVHDVRHATSVKKIDNKTGLINMKTDMGSFEHTVLFNPLDPESLKNAINKNSNEFVNSDNEKHTKPRVESVDDPLFKTNNKTNTPKQMGSLEKVDVGGKEEQKVNYQTDIDITSPNKYVIKRVHTNNPPGVYVNKDMHKYGKTLHTYDMNDLNDKNNSSEPFNTTKTTETNEERTEQKIPSTVDKNAKDDDKYKNCCLVPPCSGFPICPRSNMKKAYLSVFLQANDPQIDVMNENVQKIIQQKNNDPNLLSVIKEEVYKQLQNITKSNQTNEIQQQLDNEQQIPELQRFNKLSQNRINKKIRRRTRFPDAQFTCMQQNLVENLNYFCQQEVSKSYRKYCDLFYQQIDILIEEYLYENSISKVCNKIYMC